MNNPKQPSPQFEPKFKLGDPVRVISILGYIDEITEIIAVDKDDPNAPYKIDLLDREGCGIWCSEDAIALYDESKHRNLSQETANCDKSEDNKLKDKMNQTIEEKAMQRAWCEYRGVEYVEGFINPLPSDNFEKGYMLGRRDALASQWRSVEDELPKPEQDVLVTMGYGEFGVAWLTSLSNGTCKWYSNDDTLSLDNVKYWMPIPEPPKHERMSAQDPRECKHYNPGCDNTCDKNKHKAEVDGAYWVNPCRLFHGFHCPDFTPKTDKIWKRK